MNKPTSVMPAASDTRPVRTVQCAAGLIVASALLNLASRKLDSSAALDLADSVFDLTVGCALLTLTFTGIFRRRWRSIAWIGCALIVAGDGVTGVLHGEIVMFLISIMLLMMGAGALLPWSLTWQGSFNIFCVAAWSSMCLSAGRLDADEAAQWVGVLTAAAIALAVTAMRERFERDRERSDRKIRESEEKLRKVFEVSSDIITITSLANGHYIDVNPAFEASGYTRAEAVGASHFVYSP